MTQPNMFDSPLPPKPPSSSLKQPTSPPKQPVTPKKRPASPQPTETFESVFMKFIEKKGMYSSVSEVLRAFLLFCAVMFQAPFGELKHMKDDMDWITNRFGEEGMELFAKCFLLLREGWQGDLPSDRLGEFYMKEVITKSGQKSIGQFFTPIHIAEFMAAMLIGDGKGLQEFVTEPAAGSGVMILAYEKVRRQRNLKDYRYCVVAQDVDPMCALITYVQFSIWDIPAVVACANTLTMDPPQWVWYTPAFHLGFWHGKWARHRDAAFKRAEVRKKGG